MTVLAWFALLMLAVSAMIGSVGLVVFVLAVMVWLWRDD